MTMKDLLEFLHRVGHLKKTKRRGWILRSIPEQESVAEHSFRTTMLAYVLADDLGVNSNKLIKMALIHDLAESIVGDITPADKVPREEKFVREKKAMEKISGLLKNGKEINDLWLEFEAGKTKEARLLRQLDKFEFLLQAFEYEKDYPKKKRVFDEFWVNGQKMVKHKKLLKLLGLMARKRKNKIYKSCSQSNQ